MPFDIAEKMVQYICAVQHDLHIWRMCGNRNYRGVTHLRQHYGPALFGTRIQHTGLPEI